MPYVDRQNRVCGFLDIEDHENSNKFQRRYFILDTQENLLRWYMDNPQNLPSGTEAVGSLQLTYISKVSEATVKQKPKAAFCFVINALSRRYFLQANDSVDLKEWVMVLNNATKITVPKMGGVQPSTEVTTVTSEHHVKKQQAYKTEIIGGVVVHTPINQNEAEDMDTSESGPHPSLRRLQSSVAAPRPGVLRWGYCVKQGNVRKSWKRRFFTLDDSSVSYYKCETDKEPLRSIFLKDIQKVQECLVKSGDLLTRDNLFQIITSARTFYIQTDTPEDMHGWIRDIYGKMQELQRPVKECGFTRTSSLHRSSLRGRTFGAEDRKPQLIKSCSVAPSWQPWTPVPPSSSSSTGSGTQLLAVEEAGESRFSSLPLLSRETGDSLGNSRRRHKSHPQPSTDKTFPFTMDEDGVRTTDV